MFDNKIDSVYEDSQLRKSHHSISDIDWTELNTAQKCLILTIIGISAYHIIKKLIKVIKSY